MFIVLVAVKQFGKNYIMNAATLETMKKSEALEYFNELRTKYGTADIVTGTMPYGDEIFNVSVSESNKITIQLLSQ